MNSASWECIPSTQHEHVSHLWPRWWLWFSSAHDSLWKQIEENKSHYVRYYYFKLFQHQSHRPISIGPYRPNLQLLKDALLVLMVLTEILMTFQQCHLMLLQGRGDLTTVLISSGADGAWELGTEGQGPQGTPWIQGMQIRHVCTIFCAFICNVPNLNGQKAETQTASIAYHCFPINNPFKHIQTHLSASQSTLLYSSFKLLLYWQLCTHWPYFSHLANSQGQQRVHQKEHILPRQPTIDTSK